MDIKEAAIRWRNSWIDAEDEEEEKTGCNCAVCQLIRACDEYSKEHILKLEAIYGEKYNDNSR